MRFALIALVAVATAIKIDAEPQNHVDPAPSLESQTYPVKIRTAPAHAGTVGQTACAWRHDKDGSDGAACRKTRGW